MTSFSYLISIVALLLNMNLHAFECEAALGNETDQLALLAIKDQIKGDPLGALSSWNHTSHFCKWRGVTCAPSYQRVIKLDLSSLNLEGSMSPYIGNLSSLEDIFFQENNFHGEVPHEIGNLFQLTGLNLSYNSFEGEILTNLTSCSQLRSIDLGSNNFEGNIPVNLDSLSDLTLLLLNENHLTGNIPPSLGNLTYLIVLSLPENSLVGSIPNDLGRLSNLMVFQVSGNNLSGEVPHSLYNISWMFGFVVASNQLHGSLPWDMGISLPNLQIFLAGNNQFTGPMPRTLPNATQLEIFDVGGNAFVRPVPFNMGRLKNLQRLNIGMNKLGTGDIDDLNFLNSLSNSSHLEVLSLEWNGFGGLIPNTIANFSTNLKTLRLGGNRLTGSIPSGIGNLVNLTLMDMGQNLLTGIIPFGIGKLSRLNELILSENNLVGEIPSSVGNMTPLNELYLNNNSLWGSIPLSLGSCQFLNVLDLSQNELNGNIPKEVFGILSLSQLLNLSQNMLTGSLPSDGSLTNLVELDISRNKLSGEVPSMLGKCIMLEGLYMNDNNFQGTIPSSFSSLRSIQKLDLSSNEFSGQVPKFFENFPFLLYLNLSFNDLEGELPKEGVFKNASAIFVVGNEKLCGGVPELHLPACIKNATRKQGNSHMLREVYQIAGVVFCLIVLLCFFVVCSWERKSKKKHSSTSFIKDQFIKLSYIELCKATKGFSSENLIGVGSHGSVYKGFLDNEMVVAVKVLNSEKRGASKSFMAECRTLRNVRHRNLNKVMTACSSMDFKGNHFQAIVFEYMPNGNLDKWLHLKEDGQNQLLSLSLTERMNIAFEVASALEYLHHHCQTPIAHCDLKPSNILLDNEMSAHVGDFGLSKLLHKANNGSDQNPSSSVAIKGSIGYVPPEYGLGGQVSTAGDVYSYGILLLEMFTGIRPTDDMFKEGLSLHGFAKMAIPDQVIEIVDPQLFMKEDEHLHNVENSGNKRTRIEKCLLSIFEIGVACSSELPRDRMEMIEVTKKLQAARDTLFGF